MEMNLKVQVREKDEKLNFTYNFNENIWIESLL